MGQIQAQEPGLARVWARLTSIITEFHLILLVLSGVLSSFYYSVKELVLFSAVCLDTAGEVVTCESVKSEMREKSLMDQLHCIVFTHSSGSDVLFFFTGSVRFS